MHDGRPRVLMLGNLKHVSCLDNGSTPRICCFCNPFFHFFHFFSVDIFLVSQAAVMLIQNGADVSHEDESGKSALQMAHDPDLKKALVAASNQMDVQ